MKVNTVSRGPVGTLVGCENSNLPSRHLLLVNGYRLGYVVDLGLHLSNLGRLEIFKLSVLAICIVRF